MEAVFAAFAVFGLVNNLLYVVILSAAVDLVGPATPKAVVLLADIVPSLLAKAAAPFFIHRVPYLTRVWWCVALLALGMVLVALGNRPVRLGGIVLASASSGIGEVTFLLLTHHYGKLAIGGFSTGTGGAGLAGSLLFLILTSILGIKPKWALLAFVVAPFGLAAAYHRLPVREGEHAEEVPTLSFDSTLERIKPLVVPYMVPLCSVYIAEYIINQGVAPTLLFPLEPLPKWLFSEYRDMYVVYGFLYQLGVFILRLSATFGVRVRRLYLLSGLQCANVLLLVVQLLFAVPFGSIYELMAVVFYEGLLGGLSYVNTFLSVSENAEPHEREFSMGAVGISDSFGVMVAGLVSLWLEPALCQGKRAGVPCDG